MTEHDSGRPREASPQPTREELSPEYADRYIGDCSRGCTRPATVRIHKEWIVCTLHYLEYLASERSNEASLALDLMRPFRAEAEFHGCLNLVAGLDWIAEDEAKRAREAMEEMRAFERVEKKSLPDDGFRAEIGEREQERRERLAAGWPTEFAHVLWQLSGREEEEVSGLAARLAQLVGREEEDAPLEARLRSASAQPLDSILLADLTEALDLKDSEMHRLAMAYTYERHEREL